MFSKKEEELFDLEAVIPKEHKEEALVPREDIVTDAPVPDTPRHSAEACHSCSRSSNDVVLMPVFHQGLDKWICPKCLKSAMDSDTHPSYYGDNQDYGSAESYSSAEETPTGSSEGYGSPMSMFD